MGIEYKIDVLARLKEKGWSAYKLGHEKQLSETTGIAQSDISKIENGSGNPTIKILKNCGISSMLVFLRKAPTLVTLGSPLVVQPFFSSASV